MDFGMPTLVENKNLEENISLCRELDLQFVELNMNFPMYQLQQLEKTDMLQKLAVENGIYFTIHLDENLNVCDFNPLVAEAYLGTVERALHVAHKIGAPLLNMHMNHGINVTLPDRKVRLFSEYREVYLSAMRRFCRMCEDVAKSFDVRICVENTDGFLDFETEAIEELLQSDLFALTWDIGHSHTCGNVDEPFLMCHKDRLYHFHIHDGLRDKNHQTLGTGEIDLAQRIGVARECGSRCVVETKTIDALRKSVIWLKTNGYMSD